MQLVVILKRIIYEHNDYNLKQEEKH